MGWPRRPARYSGQVARSRPPGRGEQVFKRHAFSLGAAQASVGGTHQSSGFASCLARQELEHDTPQHFDTRVPSQSFDPWRYGCCPATGVYVAGAKSRNETTPTSLCWISLTTVPGRAFIASYTGLESVDAGAGSTCRQERHCCRLSARRQSHRLRQPVTADALGEERLLRRRLAAVPESGRQRVACLPERQWRLRLAG